MKPVLRALIVEDSNEDALLLVRHLTEGGYEPKYRRVDTPTAMADALDSQAWDVIFADYSMPHFTGTHALSLVRERALDVPFIFVSGSIGEDVAVEAMRLGAQDYVMKNNMARLLPAIERELREALRRREQRRAEDELKLLQTLARTTTIAPDVPAVLAATLKEVCETSGWVLAQAWLPRADGALIECSPVCYSRTGGFEKFRAANLRIALAAGQDLPGRVWSSHKALWITDVAQSADFARAELAADAGMKTAVAIPVIADKNVLAVLELFLSEPRVQDVRELGLLQSVAEQLGSVIQRKHAEARLHHLAHFDALTGLPNRLLFVDRLNRAMVDASRHQRLVGVALLDLDRFKTINDSLGHGVGDLLLKGTADRLSACVREGDTVARLAGDEFTLILSDMGHQDHAAHVAKKILNSLAQPFQIDGHELFTSASLGMTLYPTDDGSIDGLLRNADVAMYRAKQSGGNGYAFYSVDMTVKARERLALENELHQALAHDQLLLHYQPIVDLRSGEVDTFEALVRWRHPRRGLMTPGEFIPLAEESGLIVSLGEWVLRTACQQFHACRDICPGMRLAVNVSARQFQQRDVAQTMLAIVRDAGLAPDLLELEITESLLMRNMETTLAVMRELSDHGVRFSIDDFGTGYSSLGYLKNLPIARVKIDRSFVSNIPRDTNDVAIVAAIISMAHDLGLQVIAEGVETREQVDLLRKRGCDAVQGHYYSVPLPASEMMLRFKQRSGARR